MVAAVLFHHRLNPRISIANHHRREILHDVLLSMRFGLTRDLPLRRSFAYYSINSSGSREQHRGKSPVTMATNSENLVKTATEETYKGENKKKEEVSLPPPPEKPEPGDCCGSGCVRCVWDVYYDELDEYNKLISPKSGENKSN
ncbi:unnamed protein product [Arabis nemorensis]|uniref:Oxidoreductase-like domain-containing protein n=1 Tax=Arabis nemorensis TaxID=586526 RepID=A0A565CXJ9_9BRAS|nr:unnamed protein product [Arabis nemorensis]